MTNEEYIQKYKNENVILTSNYVDSHTDKIISNVINPYELDFRQMCSPTDNQFTDPHCAGFAAAQLIESIYWKETGIPIQLDANQIYAKAKEIDGKPDEDGTYPEYTLKAALHLCKDLIDVSEYDAKTYYKYAVDDLIEYSRFMIHKHMFILGGFRITKSWYNANKFRNIISKDDKFVGNHACLICGYNKKNFIIQNSWGRKWGNMGFAQIENSVFINQFICGSYLDVNGK